MRNVVRLIATFVVFVTFAPSALSSGEELRKLADKVIAFDAALEKARAAAELVQTIHIRLQDQQKKVAELGEAIVTDKGKTGEWDRAVAHRNILHDQLLEAEKLFLSRLKKINSKEWTAITEASEKLQAKSTVESVNRTVESPRAREPAATATTPVAEPQESGCSAERMFAPFRKLVRIETLHAPGSVCEVATCAQGQNQEKVDDCAKRNDLVCAKFFAMPAQFDIPTFAGCGAEIGKRGVIIYEDMQFRTFKNGDYEVEFVMETPDVPVTIRLQLVVKVTENCRIPITIPAIEINGIRNGIFGEDVKPVEQAVHRVTFKGRSLTLAKCEGKFECIGRTGNARFGYGVKVP